MNYVALDVETANADCASVCQIGLAEFGADGVGQRWVSLVDPEDYFDGMNVSIHGIDETMVRGAPRFPDIISELRDFCHGQIVVHHMPFDRVAIRRACQRYDLPEIEAKWLDSARVARRAWDRFSRRGYGLKNLAAELAISLEHHDALSDAVACGNILLKAISDTGMDANDWLDRARAPLPGSSATRRGDPNGHLFGETIVFTGALTMPRREAADLAAAAGADVANSVSRKTTIVVVGVQDLRRTGGRAKSSKHRKAEELMAQGHDVSIIGEQDFLELVAFADAR